MASIDCKILNKTYPVSESTNWQSKSKNHEEKVKNDKREREKRNATVEEAKERRRGHQRGVGEEARLGSGREGKRRDDKLK